MSIIYKIDESKRIYINIIDRYRCTNDCVFCDREKIEDKLGVNLYLSDKPSFDEIKARLIKIDEDVEEFVFCGLGEPTLELQLLLKTAKYIKKSFNSKVRLVTNGHGDLIHGREIASELKDGGVDIISVSLNSLSKENYELLHRPKYENAFDSVKKFIKNCPTRTVVTFISFYDLDKDKAAFLAKNLGAEVRFRNYF